MTMFLASIRTDDDVEEGAVVVDDGVIPLRLGNRAWGSTFPTDLLELIRALRVPELRTHVESGPVPGALRLIDAPLAPPFRRPGKIWGIGLNYREHAHDLDEDVPAQPASFMKPATAVIGARDTIVLPSVTERVTAEAELGVVIGRRCRNLSADEAEKAVLGFTPVIDMTAEDILRQNPRYLTRSKSFDTFFSFGPMITMRDDVHDVEALTIRTVHNDEVSAENSVSNMTFGPYEIVRFHSQAMTLEPGDIISTGTPGACVIAPGDRVRCEISGFPVLENDVARAPS